MQGQTWVSREGRSSLRFSVSPEVAHIQGQTWAEEGGRSCSSVSPEVAHIQGQTWANKEVGRTACPRSGMLTRSCGRANQTW